MKLLAWPNNKFGPLCVIFFGFDLNIQCTYYSWETFLVAYYHLRLNFSQFKVMLEKRFEKNNIRNNKLIT